MSKRSQKGRIPSGGFVWLGNPMAGTTAWRKLTPGARCLYLWPLEGGMVAFLPTPTGTTTGAISADVGGTTTGSISNIPSSVPPTVTSDPPNSSDPMTQYYGIGSGRFEISVDPRAMEQFGTTRYAGRPYLIVNYDISGQFPRKKNGRQPTVSLKVLEVMPVGEALLALSISEICKRAGVPGLGPVIQAMRKAGKLVRVGRGQYSKAA
jgi:hypothetical protein